jgi:DNA-binding CsgD family transcriptional regulator
VDTERIQCRTKAAKIYRKTGNLRAVQLLLGHSKAGSTVRYLGVELEDALNIAERIGLKLGVAYETVKVFWRQIYKKCNISSQAELFSLFVPLISR